MCVCICVYVAVHARMYACVCAHAQNAFQRGRARAQRRAVQGGDLHLGITVHMYIVI
jgi:hypothetical protein